MKLRPIQEQAIQSILASFRAGGTYHLVNAPVAFGKTVMASELMRRSSTKYGAKCLFLAHLRELVVQTVEKFKAWAPDLSCGVFMGSVKQEADILIGTRQTVERNLERIGAINLLIIDECHYFSSKYKAIVDYFLAKNPRLRVLGVTGTPFSSKGWLYGEGKIWPDPCFSTTIDQMIELGYLSKFRYKVADSADLRKDLVGVGVSGGDFKEEELGELMANDRHIGSVSEAIKEHCHGRKRIMVFGVTIDHAEKLASHLGCFVVHSGVEKKEWRRRVDRFKAGEDRVLVNVSQLSVGFDCPEVDALIIARPTLSASLGVQIAGRALRVCDGKTDALIIDLCGNYARIGLPNHPKVAGGGFDETKEKEMRANICPECLEVVEGPDENCPFCGAEMVEKIKVRELNERIRLEEIETQKLKPKFVRWSFKDHTTQKGNKGVMFFVGLDGRKPLYRFAGHGTKKLKATMNSLKGMRKGQTVEIINTAYGQWFETASRR